MRYRHDIRYAQERSAGGVYTSGIGRGPVDRPLGRRTGGGVISAEDIRKPVRPCVRRCSRYGFMRPYYIDFKSIEKNHATSGTPPVREYDCKAYTAPLLMVKARDHVACVQAGSHLRWDASERWSWTCPSRKPKLVEKLDISPDMSNGERLIFQ